MKNSGPLTQTCCYSAVHLDIIYPLTLIPLLYSILFPPCLPSVNPFPSQCSSPLAVISQSSPVQEFSESSALSSLRLVCSVFTSGTPFRITFLPGQASHACTLTLPFSFCRCTPSYGSRLCLS